MKLFAKEGVANVSVRQIAAAIGYSPGAIYRYYRNKHEILATIREQGFEEIVSHQRKRVELYSDPFERLKVGGREYIRFALERPDFFELMFCTDCNDVDLSTEHTDHSKASYALFAQTVKECLDTGYFGDMDLDTVMISLWSGAYGLAHQIKTGRVSLMVGTDDLDDLIDSVLDFYLRPTDMKQGS